jgi:hypothetical protein
LCSAHDLVSPDLRLLLVSVFSARVTLRFGSWMHVSFSAASENPGIPSATASSLALFDPTLHFPPETSFLTAEALSTGHLVIHLPRCDHRSHVVGTYL